MDHDEVARLIRHVHTTVIAPRFEALDPTDVEAKSPGELVTVADRLAEELLADLLRDVVDAPVVGEEAAAADPELVELVSGADAVWLVDPIDGTANFVDGSPEYAVMVALVETGRTTAGWILQPADDRMATAALGAGAEVDGAPVRVPVPDEDPASWRAVVKDRFLPEQLRDTVADAGRRFASLHQGRHCAGREYPSLVDGDHTFLFYWRTHPWDHAPGVLLAEESGCRALRPNGTRYAVTDPTSGLLVAEASMAPTILSTLLGGPSGRPL